ncbi:MAG: lipid A export permease/ATP-binding protein MsbA [Pseudomonadales bacterium]
MSEARTSNAPEPAVPTEDAEPGSAAELPPRTASSDWGTYRRLLGYVKPHWFAFLLGVIGFQMGSAAEAYFAKMFGDLIDSWPATSISIPLFMLFAAFARGFGEIAGEILLSRISFSVVHVIRSELFEQLLYLPSRFFDASSQGHLVSRITYNVTQLRSTATDALQTVVQDGGKLLVYVSVMLYMSWKLTLIFVVTAPVIALIVGWASRRFRRISRRIQNSMGDVTHVASEAVSGYRVVRIFGGESYERDRFNRSSLYNQRQNLKMVATKVVSTQVIQIFVAVALSVLIAVLFRPEVGGELTTGEIVTFLGLAGLMARPLRKLTEVNARLQRGLAAAEDIFSQLDEARETDTGTFEVDRVQGRLEFRNVNFGYASGSGPVLKDLNLVIEPGQTVALVGKSGSGKSTLASLIPRFYEPDSGEILLDGQPLRDYRLDALRRQIALVTQQVTLFNGTLADNIAYGSLADASDDAMQDAIARAHADVFINELPNGLDTLVGDDGVLLSGGQRQRVAIARALLKNAPVLILDEATSALDTTAERHIQAALEEVMRGRTTLVIAHRLSTIENADVILVMQDGRIVESGRHSALLANGGVYAELYNAQFEETGNNGVAPAGRARSRGEPRQGVRTAPALPAVERRLSPLVNAWYAQSGWLVLLAPLSWIYGSIARRRRLNYLTGASSPWRPDVPVIVVGNIAAGGTGKTPFVIWLVRALSALGFRPGIVSRGHGGADNSDPVEVRANSSAESVGDEAPMLAARTGVPVVICRDRVRAVQTLLESHVCDLVVADDGLQHYALARDVEVALIDGHRGLGNRRLLPAGPLREPAERLDEVDWVVSSGRRSGTVPGEWLMTVEPLRFVGLGSAPDLSIDAFVDRFVNVNAVAGIGNPGRFLQTLKELGLQPLLNAYPDHHRFSGGELEFDNGWPVVCTEKDATKVRDLENIPDNVWFLEVGARLTGPEGEPGTDKLSALLALHGIRTP